MGWHFNSIFELLILRKVIKNGEELDDNPFLVAQFKLVHTLIPNDQFTVTTYQVLHTNKQVLIIQVCKLSQKNPLVQPGSSSTMNWSLHAPTLKNEAIAKVNGVVTVVDLYTIVLKRLSG